MSVQNDKQAASQNIHADSSPVLRDPITGVETTGHVWDDNIQEFNNPLPLWWLWGFYATVLFAIGYWVIYPSWPVGFMEKGYLPGISSITYENEKGEPVTAPWNMRSLLAYEQQNEPLEKKRNAMVKDIANMDYADIASDAEKLQFVQSYGKGIFGDYCAGCHQTGGQGVMGHYPNLIDDAWLWGGDAKSIEHTIRNGRNGLMPSHNETLTSDEIDNVAYYVLNLSLPDAKLNTTKVAAGETVYVDKGCAGCHGADAKGMSALGAANLTDQIWTVATVPLEKNIEGKLDTIRSVVRNGIQRKMPAWQTRLSDDEIKILVAYLRSLSSVSN